MIWRFGPEQLPDPGDIGGAVAVSEDPIVANAVLTSGEHVDQEPADDLICGQCHGGVAACTFETVIFDAEGDAALIKMDQAAVGNCDPPSHGLLCKPLPVSGGCSGIDTPARLWDRRRVLWRRVEDAPLAR